MILIKIVLIISFFETFSDKFCYINSEKVYFNIIGPFVLTAMLHLTVATHYCGEVAASRISLSGKLASCGMEVADEQLGEVPDQVPLL
jgi:hypothetical protein